MRRKLSVLFLPGLTALALACTQAGPAAEPAPQSTPGGPMELRAMDPKDGLQCEPGKEHWRSPGPPIRGGTLQRSSSPNDHFDVTKTGGGALTAAAPQVAQTLVEARQCHYEDTFMVPSLARGWEVTPDGLTWTFHLRDGVKWHNKPPVNGRAFTAADVGWMIDYQKREGLQRAYWEEVSHTEPDPSTVVMTLKDSNADFLVQLGYQQNVMLPHEVKEQLGDFKTVAIGTGAFQVKEYRHNQEYLLEPNPDYYEMGIDGKPLPYLAAVRTVVFADAAAEMAALRAGQIDTTKFNGIEKLEADNIRQSHPLGLRVEEQFNPAVIMVYFDNGKAPLNDARVRKAIAKALDPEDFIARYQGGAVRAGYFPASLIEFAWSQEKLKERFTPDPEAAKRLLAEAGFHGEDHTFLLKTGGVYQQDAEIIQQRLQAVGVRTKVEIEGSAFSPVFQKSEFDLAVGPPGGITYANYWIRDLLAGPSAPRHLKALNDPEVTRLALAQGREIDPAKRKALIDQLQERLYEVMPEVPLITHLYYHVRSCRVKNASLYNPSYNARMPVEAWLDSTGCPS